MKKNLKMVVTNFSEWRATMVGHRKPKKRDNDVRTVPGQDPGILVLVGRMTRGQFVNTKQAEFSLNSIFDRMMKMDKVDKRQLAKDKGSELASMRAEILKPKPKAEPPQPPPNSPEPPGEK